jgi:hypothetical protein
MPMTLVYCSIVRKNTYVLLGTNRKVSLEINTKKTKYMVVSRQADVGHVRSL